MQIIDRVLVTDSGVGGTGKYRGAQVASVTANSLTCRVLLEANMPGWRTFPRSYAPAAILGDPLCLEVSGDGAESYQVVAAHASHFGGGGGSNDSVARGEFCFGLVPDHLSGQKRYTPWWSGLRNERSRFYY